MGNHSFAIQDFEEAIRIDPRYSLSRFHLGVSKLKSRQIREAIEDFKQADELDNLEENPGIFDGLGCCYHALRDYPQAIEYFDMALEKEPTNIDFLKNRAQCYFNMNQFEESIADLETALEYNPTDP